MFNLPPHNAPQRDFPKQKTVLTKKTNPPLNVTQQNQTEPDILPRRFLGRPLDLVRKSVFDLIFVALQQLSRFISAAHAFAPGVRDFLIRQAEIDVGFTPFVLDQAVLARQPVPERGLWQRLKQIDGEKRDLRGLDELKQMLSGLG